jgi:O-antigen/teichoic acid export membrane protein
MKSNVWPIVLIVLGLCCLYLTFVSPAKNAAGFFVLALAIGFLGSGCVLVIAGKKYPLRHLRKRNHAYKHEEPQPHTAYPPHIEYMEQFVSEIKKRD